MSSRGLPGFLRRSRRWNDFEDDEEEEEEEAVGNTTTDGNDETENGDDGDKAVEDHVKRRQQYHRQQQQQQQESDEPSHLMDASLQFLDPSPLAASLAQEAVVGTSTAAGDYNNGELLAETASQHFHRDKYYDQQHDDQASLSTLGDYDPTTTTTSSSTPHRSTSNASSTSIKVGYRELQFEKILSNNNNVVKLSELRKVGWNGIPVRWLSFCFAGTTADVVSCCFRGTHENNQY